MADSALTIQQTLAMAVARLPSDSPRLDAEILLALALNKSRTHLIAWPEKHLNPEQAERFETLLTARSQGTPVAYLTGKREFWSLPIRVTPDVLIPRPDTELLVETALATMPLPPCDVLDLGTGSGAIALALASERPQWRIHASDASSAALAVARTNAEHLRLNINFGQGNWFQPFPAERFHLIVSNPPYICDEDPHLQQGDVRHEPDQALSSGSDGLDDIRLITGSAPSHLHPQGWLMLEHGYNQAEEVRKIMENHHFTQICSHQDLSGIERITIGQTPGSET